MFLTYTHINELIEAVETDRHLTGANATTANRFPVRFVLFDNFRDCCQFVEHISHFENMQIVRIDDWMDADYPDTMLTHSRLAAKIKALIDDSPTEYRIVMPFSELARFYNNTPEQAEFNSLINTIKSFDTSATGYQHKQRVYIPIVGLEGKMQHFRDDSQSFIWYFHNEDQQLSYNLLLTDGNTFGVSGLDTQYTIARNVMDWLQCWKYPELKSHIISASPAIFSHAKYAQPDNAFTFCPCRNAYEFLTKGLNLDIASIPYKEEECVYWDILAKRINIENFHFVKFFHEQFGIYQLEDYTVFFRQWFEHKDNFMRWLLCKYYTERFCNEGYICRVLERLNGYSDTAFAQALALTIFSLDNPEQYIEERKIGMRVATDKHIELPENIQKYLIEKLTQVEKERGVQVAIDYLTSLTYEEKALVIRWYAEGKLQAEQLKDIYPDLFSYLSKTIASAEEGWVLDYIDCYKHAKVTNQYTDAVKDHINAKNENELTHYKWTSRFATTRTILNNRTDISHYVWIDGLGLDWIPLIAAIVKEHEQEGYYLNEALVATAQLPTRTDINKKDIEILSGGLLTKYGDLDEIAHSCRPYPMYIIQDIDKMREVITKILVEHPNEKIAIVSDHGMSYLSSQCQGYNLKGYKSDHYGRVAIHTTATPIVKDDKYVIIDKKTICALKHESLMAKIPNGMGAHGGCTPEEQLVPILIISPEKEKQTWTATQRSFDLTETEPVFKVDIVGLPNGVVPMIEYNGRIYAMKGTAVHYESERIQLQKDIQQVILHVGMQTKTFDITVKLAVQEDDIFKF